MERAASNAEENIATRARRWFDAAIESGDVAGFLREHESQDAEAITRARQLLSASQDATLVPLLDAQALIDPEGTIGGSPQLLEIGQSIGTPAGPGTVEALLSDHDQRRFAEVYRVGLTGGGRCAMKVLRESVASSETRRRFRAEAAALARLENPGIARLLTAGHVHTESGDRLQAIAMQLVEGESLREWAASRTSIEIAHAVAFVARATHYAHLRGVVHRDIKPANIVVDRADRPILLDLGVARLLRLNEPDSPHATMTTQGGIVGTPHYMAPEQFTPATRTVDLRCDVYALGLVLYELLTGRAMVDIAGLSQAEALERKLAAHPMVPRGLSAHDQLLTVAICAAAPEPEQRHESAQALADDIDRALEGRPLRLRPPGWARRTLLFARRNWLPLAASAMMLAAMLVAGVVYGVSQREVAAARDRAEARFEDTRSFARWVIFDLTDELSMLPGSMAARRELIDHALATLSRLASDPIAGDALLLELAEAYARLSELLVWEVGDQDGSHEPLAAAMAMLDRLEDRATPAALMLRCYVEFRHYRDSMPGYDLDMGPRREVAYRALLQRMVDLEPAQAGDDRYWRWRSEMRWNYSRRVYDATGPGQPVIDQSERAVSDARRAIELAPENPLAQFQLVQAEHWLAYANWEAQHPDAFAVAQDALAAAESFAATGHPRARFALSRARTILFRLHAGQGHWDAFEAVAREAIEDADAAAALLPDHVMVVRHAEVVRVQMAQQVLEHFPRSPEATGDHAHLPALALEGMRRAREMYRQRERRGWINFVEQGTYAEHYDNVLQRLEGMQ